MGALNTFHLELEVNLLVHYVIEREVEREKVQMKPPKVDFEGKKFSIVGQYQRKMTKVCHSMSSMNVISLLPQCYTKETEHFSNLFRFL